VNTPRVRLSAAALAIAGVLFLLYPAVRPWHDESTVSGALASMRSGAWVASHLFAILGFILLPLGLLGLRSVPLGWTAVIVTWIGAGLVLPYYGAEDFGLHAAATEPGVDIVHVAESVRYNPAAVTIFGAGLIALAAGGVITAIAVWRSGVLPQPSGIAFGLGFALFLPQFYTPAAVRVAHGVLVAIGCAWLAAAMWRAEPNSRPAQPRDVAASPP
jgi:hypothetical protein